MPRCTNYLDTQRDICYRHVFFGRHVSSTSSFTPLETQGPAPPAGVRRSLIGALDGIAFTLPVSLGSANLVFGHVGPELLPAGLFALLLSLAWMHATTASNRRPVLYSARFFEAMTLSAMMGQLVDQLPAWGLANTMGVRLAFLCLIGAGGGLCAGLLYMSRADRLTRLIPSPVFAGFSNSIALALLVSQSRSLWDMLSTSPAVAPVVSIAVAVFAISLALRYLSPRWPGTTIGMLVGLALGLVWSGAGSAPAMLGGFGWWTVLPVTLADFGSLAEPTVHRWQVAVSIGANAAILGTMMFVNTTMTAEYMAQSEGRRAIGRRHTFVPVIGVTLAGLVGSAPLSGSLAASAIASRNTVLTPALMLFCALIAALIYLSGVIGLIPVAAVCGGLLCEAWFLVDRSFLRLLMDWVQRRTVSTNGREDLALIVSVMAAAVLVNMVAAVFVGLLFGLVLLAARNARRPVRHVWTGLQLTSNCARSRADIRLLGEHGKSIRVFELDGDLFFGAIESLERSLDENSEGNVTRPVFDWSRVRHLDTSVALAIVQFERRARLAGIAPVHAGAGVQARKVADVLHHHLPLARYAPDLDRALEQVENDLIQAHATGVPQEITGVMEAASLFDGLDEPERDNLEAAMPSRFYKAGEVILQAGAPGDELMLLLHGSASVVLHRPDGTDIRLAGIRRGATFGEIAFLDHAARSATVIADEDTTVAVLSRARYGELCASHPHVVQRLTANIALNLATSLRRQTLARLGHG
jgi:sulfate permease, SulP family